LYVKNRSKTDYVKFTDLTIDEQNKMKPNMIPDFVALVGSRVNQKQIPKIEYKNGKLSLSKEHKQTTRQDKFFEELGIEYNIIDPFVTTYMFSEDGRRVERKRVNIFGDSTNLSEKNLKIINGLREQFNIEMGISREIDGKPIVGENNEVGMLPMRLAPNINPLAIKNSDLTKIRKKFDEFAKIYLSEESPLNEQVKNQIKEIQKSIQVAEDNGRLASGDDYVAALRRLYFKDMLTGNDAIGGDLLFVDFLNGKVDIDKLMGRTKLYDTKKFVTYDQDFIIDVADSYQYIGDRETYKTLMKRVSKNSFGIAVWDDGTSDVREETRKYIENSNLDYVLENAIGDAHKDVSGFDSISYVRKEVLQYLHAMQGHDPNSFNPIKPVISSGGANSPLLMGKTLFIYSKDLDGFFNKQQNKDVDILLSKSGAKSLNAVQEIGADNKPFGKDKSLISNVTWDGLNDYKIKDEKNQIRRVSLSSVGVKPEKDVVNTTGKKSHADMNYARNDESARYFNEEINTPLTQSIRNAQEQIKNPISARRYILDSFGDDSLVSMIDGTESLKHLNGMQFFAGLTRDANPMSFSESIVKNKLYGAFIDPLINNKRSVTNQHDIQNSENYGGQASLVQIPVGYSNMDSRLRPTLVKEDGTYVSRGEVFLPNNVSEMKIAALIDKGYELRLVNDNDVYELTSRMKELGEEKTFQDLLDIDVSLRDLHEFVKTVGIEKGTPNLQIGIIARRNPRTRPNDLSLMGLKGFLEKEYGNSMMLNSFDVANIFEGDYDADKADFFFAERKNMFDHIQRTSAYWVQGVDPTKFMEKSNFSFQLNSTLENEAIEQMSANLDLYKSSIGLVQKVPRMLNYLGNLGSDVATKSVEGKQVAVDVGMIGEENSKVLFEGKDFKIVMDYNNTDFYQRSALETQYIIDGKGKLNQEISNDIYSWRNRFLFPTMKESKSPRQLKEEMDSQQRIGFQNEISRSGHSNKQRVRIFKRLDRQTDGTFSETQDMSNLDKTIVKEFLSEYGKFLSVTGNTAYEKSGEQRRVSYEDIMAASDRFFNFNSKLRESLYYRLRNRNVSLARDKQNKLINKQKFKDTEEFKELFGVQNKAFTDQDGKPIEGKFYQVSTNEKMFDNTVKNNSQEFSEGRRGSPIERTLHKLWDANIFEETRVETLTGQAKEYMNRWYDEFVFDETKGKEEIETSSKRLKDNVLKTLTSVNQKINFIKSLNKKIMQIKYNKFQKYDIRMASIEKLNILKEEVQKEVKDFLGNKYFKTKSSKDLEKIEFVDVNTSNMKKGTVYYATIEQIKKFMPLINGDDNFGLNSDAIDKLKDIKQYRRMFYGNQDNLKETLKYGGRSMLSVEQQRFLENFPDMNTYYDIESQLLLQGVNKHGLKFLWAFMQPSVNKYKIGVFEGNPIAVPFEAKEGYDPSSRYRRGLNFLTTVAMERKIGGVDIDPEIAGVSRRALSYVQMVEAQFERFFNKRFDAQKLVSENIGEAFEYGDKQQLKLVYDSIKLPNFHKDFEKRFGDFGTIQWTKTGDRIKNGFGLFNDHLFNFYRELMQAAGKEAEFDTYLKEMHTFQDLMMSNNVINPLQYIHARNGMDADIKNIAQKSLQTALTGKVGSPEISKNLMSNPIYALMGGNSFWKGLTLERQAKFTKEGLKNMAGLSKTIENVKLKSPINETSEERFRKLKDDLIQSGQC